MGARRPAKRDETKQKPAQFSGQLDVMTRRHLVAGWFGLLVFLTLGIALEAMHGLKLDFYLDLRNSPRRLLWTLAHTHGTLLSLVTLAFAWTTTQWPATRGRLASYGLITAQVVMPLGFFLGGVKLYAGDPNLSILLVPVGAFALLGAVLQICRGLWRS